MRIYSFFASSIDGNKILIEDKKEIKHLLVLRLKTNDKIRLIFNNNSYISVIESVDKNVVSCKIESKIEDKYTLKREIDLYVGITKPNALSELVRHVTEIGILNIYPIYTEYSFKSINIDRLQLIANEAIKQCLAVKKTIVHKPIKLSSINFEYYDILLLAKERSKSKTISSYSKRLILSKKIAYIVGPEGGLSDNEKKYLEDKSVSISLGERILRTETASILIGGYISCLE
jgi:16S rRNA (uracil1498-N3)-methyltransferase